MKLIELSLEGFVNELAGSSPAPGGGSTAAMEGAFGSGLIAMVCELTLGNKKYEDCTETVSRIKEEAHRQKEVLLKTVDEDTAAFNLVSDAFGMPKQTEEEKALRREAIQNGLKQCCLPPLQVMNAVNASLKLAEELIVRYNTSTASDLGTGILSLKTAGLGAYLNVLINVSGIKDEGYATQKRQEAEELKKQLVDLADRLYGQIEAELAG